MSSTAPSNSQNPDLDWSQIRETVLMLNLAVAQIETAMKEGDESVNTLTNSFTTMVGNAQVINLAAKSLADGNEKNAILENCQDIQSKMQSAIMAFQFYDKLSQRVSHVSDSLAALGELVGNPSQLYNPYEWKGLQEKIKSKYTVAADKALFDALLGGASVDEVLAMTQELPAAEDDIELF